MRTVTLALAFAVLLAVLHRLVGDEATAACITVAGLLAIAAPRRGAGRPRIRGAWAALAAGVVAVLAVSWIGAHSAQAAWFGGLSSHGPRSSNEVALTFDDGPNPPYTDQIREVLARYGAVGTFFEVGQAVEASPDTVRALLAAGDVIGNHTYAHARWSYLDPRYPELARAQQTFTSTVERCPALFRPPHGTHTPWMSRVAGEHGLRVVTWDVEAADWTEDDPQRLARNILDRVQPGSIVLLHDGIDGHIGADRSVVVKALPLILEGLRARQLQAVSLDRLLNVPAYLPNCPA